MRAVLALGLSLMILTSCALGPELKPPAVTGASGGWITSSAPGQVDGQWWQALHDPVLDAMVADATSHNLDLREAEARLGEARANRDAAAARALPDLNAKGSAAESQLSGNGQIPINRIPGFARRYSLFDGGFDASWEIDLWGGVRRATEAATARRTGAEAHVADVRLQIIAETARAYGQLRAAQARLANAGVDAALLAEIAALTDRRVASGDASGLEGAQARQHSDSSQAAVAGWDADVQGNIYRLSLLTGAAPEALVTVLTPVAPIPSPPAVVAMGLRSDILQRRADVRGALANLAAATADLGVEKTILFPRVSLVGSLGQQAKSLDDIASAASTRFQVGPSFSWPILSVGRIRAQIHAADARAEAAAIAYEKAVLSALSDSETAVNRYANAQATRDRREGALRQSVLVADLAERRYQAGEDDRIAWLQARSASLAVEQQAITAREGAVTNYVSLAKALGGGW